MKKFMLVAVVFTLIFSLLPVGYGHAQSSEPIVKVKLKNYLGNQNAITLQPYGDYVSNDPTVILKSGISYLLKIENGKLSLYNNGSLLNSFTTLSLQPALANGHLTINNRPYLGSFDFTIENNQYIRPINAVKMEDYIKGVVPIEMYPSWNIEALKTQAVAARTYAMSYISRGVIDDSISYQVYGGYIWTENTTRAVDETKGQVAQYNGRLIDAVYSASNGGKTENNSNAWGTTTVAYLPIKEDPYDPKTVWSFTIQKNQIDLTSKDMSKSSEWWSSVKESDPTITSNIKMWLNNNGYANKDIKITAIPDLSLYAAGSGGRVTKGKITVDFLVKDKIDGTGNLIPQRLSLLDVSASKLRSMIGNRVMLSYLVDSIQTDTKQIQVKGFGDGHGVGMSQWGSQNMAKSGKNYQDILTFYYSGITIVKMYDVESTPITTPVTNPVTTSGSSQSTTAGSSQTTTSGSGQATTSGSSQATTSGSSQTTTSGSSQAATPVAHPVVPQVKAGWVKSNGRWYYNNSNGTKKTGWLKDANQWYYLNQKGEMLTGWQKVGGKWYFLKSSGAMATGWLFDKNKWYYLTSSGAMAIGWITVQGKRYYLSSSGAMVKNKQYINGKWYTFHSSGYLIK